MPYIQPNQRDLLGIIKYPLLTEKTIKLIETDAATKIRTSRERKDEIRETGNIRIKKEMSTCLTFNNYYLKNSQLIMTNGSKTSKQF